MEKGVLLLCLSFLLITAFTAADAAALVEENQRQILRHDPEIHPAATPKPKKWLGCWKRPGGCNLIGRPDQSDDQLDTAGKKEQFAVAR